MRNKLDREMGSCMGEIEKVEGKVKERLPFEHPTGRVDRLKAEKAELEQKIL